MNTKPTFYSVYQDLIYPTCTTPAEATYPSCPTYQTYPPVYQEEVKTDMDKIIENNKKYEIQPKFGMKIMKKKGDKIVFICDDSGSMKTLTTVPNETDISKMKSRWQELKETVGIATELFAPLGGSIDFYFLNREPKLGVKSFAEVEESFKTEPSGYTPLSMAYDRVMADNKHILSERNLTVVIATDGIPTDTVGNEIDPTGVSYKTILYNSLKANEHPRVFTTVLACTDDDDVVSYLKVWDKTIKNFDFVDDYISEKIKIQDVQGKNFKFTLGDYVVKILVGNCDEEIDALDEKQSRCVIC